MAQVTKYEYFSKHHTTKYLIKNGNVEQGWHWAAPTTWQEKGTYCLVSLTIHSYYNYIIRHHNLQSNHFLF